MSIIKMRGPIDVLFAFKIFSLPVPTRPGTRTFRQVPDPSRPEVKNPYPSDPEYNLERPSTPAASVRTVQQCTQGPQPEYKTPFHNLRSFERSNLL